MPSRRPYRLLLVGLIGSYLLYAPASFAQAPPLAAPPSPALLKDLRAALDLIKPTSVEAKFERVELAVRIIQVDLALGGDTYRHIGIEPKQAKDALVALQQPFIASLNDLSRPVNRRTLWNALGTSNMLYRFFLEGTRLAGHDDDISFLEANLGLLRESWLKAGPSERADVRRYLVEEWMRGILADALRFQAIGSPDDAARLLDTVEVVPESTTKRVRHLGDPPTSTGTLIGLLAGKKLAAFDRAAHQASALQRAGCDVAFWMIAAPRILDDDIKTVANVPLIVFPDKKPKAHLVIGPDDVLADAKGAAKVQAGLYRFDSAASLKEYLDQHGQYKVAMKNVLDATASPEAWAKAIDQGLRPPKGSPPPNPGSVLDVVVGRQWADFKKEAAASLAVTAQAAFLHAVRTRNITFRITPMKDGKKQSSIKIDDIDKREPELILPKHEATLGRVLQVMPPKMLPGLRFVILQEEPHKEKKKIGVRHGDKLVQKEVETSWVGLGWHDGIMLAAPHFPSGVHEIMHCWAFSRVGKLKVGDWEGGVVDLYNDIAWEPDDDKKLKVRDGLNIVENFMREYAATDHKEDLAVAGEFYVSFPKHTRDNVRKELAKGNFVPAVKYLYLRHVAFLDKDGKCMEFETDTADPPFTMDEFRKGLRRLSEKEETRLTGEQKRLQGIARRILDVSRAMIESKLIAHRDSGERRGRYNDVGYVVEEQPCQFTIGRAWKPASFTHSI